ncbi:MAG: hypothetical protein E7536_01970 [Ruminococcaceae bacterium]|nr:hypothetical protein [Oscillospiraceae bacterium]
MGKKLEKIKEILKNDKKLLIVIIMAIVGVILLIISEFIGKEKETIENVPADSYEYTQMIEKKLVNIVSSIDGAGVSDVMVTLETGEENVYARQIKSDEEKNENKDSAQYEYEYIVIKAGASQEGGMLLKVVQPDIRGVAIVCEGGDNAAVRENIINTVSAVLDINTNKISVCKRKS